MAKAAKRLPQDKSIVPDDKIRIGWKRGLLYCLILVVAVFAVYANSLGGPFLFDDDSLVKNNPLIRSLSNIPVFFTKDIFAGDAGARAMSNSYRPLQTATYAIDYFFWRDNARGFHLTNLLIHILNTLLVLLLIQKLFGNFYISFFISLLFGIHPVNTACVSYISGRADIMAAAFILSAFLLYMRYSENKGIIFLISSILAYACAVFSKEYAILVLPLLLFCYDAIFKKDKISRARAYLFYILPLIAYIPLRINALSGLTSRHLELAQLGLVPRLLTSLKTLFIDVRILLLPNDLHFGRTTAVENSVFESPYALFTILGILAVLYFSWLSYRRWVRSRDTQSGMLFFGISWFFISMLPLLNIAPLQVFHADSWLYLSSIGIYMILAAAIGDLWRLFIKRNLFARNVSLALVCLVLLCYGFTTVKRNEDYGDVIRFYLSNLKWRPNVKFYTVVSGLYGAKNDHDNAIRYAVKAIEINREYPSSEVVGAYYNLGLTYMNLRDYERARRAFRKVRELGNEDLKRLASDHLNIIGG